MLDITKNHKSLHSHYYILACLVTKLTQSLILITTDTLSATLI